MKIKIETSVNQEYTLVYQGFNESLFIKLSPPFPPVYLRKFDGCKKGDEVHLELNFFLFKQYWNANIVDSWQNRAQYGFVDIGVKLPFFISKWKHTHLISKAETGSIITDDIVFSSPFGWLIYPILYLQFLYRKPIYKRIFS